MVNVYHRGVSLVVIRLLKLVSKNVLVRWLSGFVGYVGYDEPQCSGEAVEIFSLWYLPTKTLLKRITRSQTILTERDVRVSWLLTIGVQMNLSRISEDVTNFTKSYNEDLI